MADKHPMFGVSAHKLGGMSGKITRDAFLYLSSNKKDFAQCSSCAHMTPDKMCTDLGIKVQDGWTCALYVPGAYDGGRPAKRVPVEDSGLVKQQVRCENCKYGGEHCELFEMLNEKLPEVFSLDIKIEPKGCCNAWVTSDGD